MICAGHLELQWRRVRPVLIGLGECAGALFERAKQIDREQYRDGGNRMSGRRDSKREWLSSLNASRRARASLRSTNAHTHTHAVRLSLSYTESRLCSVGLFSWLSDEFGQSLRAQQVWRREARKQIG